MNRCNCGNILLGKMNGWEWRSPTRSSPLRTRAMGRGLPRAKSWHSRTGLLQRARSASTNGIEKWDSCFSGLLEPFPGPAPGSACKTLRSSVCGGHSATSHASYWPCIEQMPQAGPRNGQRARIRLLRGQCSFTVWWYNKQYCSWQCTELTSFT